MNSRAAALSRSCCAIGSETMRITRPKSTSQPRRIGASSGRPKVARVSSSGPASLG